MQLSSSQNIALDAINKWFKEKDFKNRPYFYLAGYAGTGKTTIEQYFTDKVEGKVVRAAFTGKAALRMQEVSGKAASTIHSIAYSVDKESRDKETGNITPKFIINKLDSPLLKAKLLVLDECSMINTEMGNDLLSFNCPILVTGDPGQLPPIKGLGFFTNKEPDAMLLEVHRQALDSNIIGLATDIRDGKTIGRYRSDDVIVYPYSKDYDLEGELLIPDQIITGMNATRLSTNYKVRALNGYDNDGYPIENDKLICLRNNRKLGIFNGMSGVVTQVFKSSKKEITISIDTDIGPRNKLELHPECFYDDSLLTSLEYKIRCCKQEFNYGYCITVHKSQGSEWDNILLLDDGFLSWKRSVRAQWLYTAVTRAAKKLTILKV